MEGIGGHSAKRAWGEHCCVVIFCMHTIQVVNCYLECYGHTYDKSERQMLAQTISTYLHRRPRYDTEASYFTSTYEMEVKTLKMEWQLLQDMINYQLMEERTYNQQVCSFGEGGKADVCLLACGSSS